jgi:uncharacterized membrane protein YphA (DoxX/SURF4 family)
MENEKKEASASSPLIQGALFVLFVFAGVAKLLNYEEASTWFEAYSYPGWFALVVGTTEILAAFALLSEKLNFLAASLISIIMFGAAATHLAFNEYPMFVFSIIILVASFKLVLEFGQSIEMDVYNDGTTSLDEYRGKLQDQQSNEYAQNEEEDSVDPTDKAA